MTTPAIQAAPTKPVSGKFSPWAWLSDFSRPGRFFWLGLVVGVCLPVVTLLWQQAHRNTVKIPTPQVLDNSEYRLLGVASQLKPEMLTGYADDGYTGIVDFRPDGEDPGQPDSATMAAAAQAAGLAFAYIPVPHGEIPPGAATELAAVLDRTEFQGKAGKRPRVLLYCRTGRRAVLTWALMEAARPGGKPLEDILAQAQSAGQPADALKEALAARIAARTPTHPKP